MMTMVMNVERTQFNVLCFLYMHFKNTGHSNRRIIYDRSLGGRAVQVTGSSAEWDVGVRPTPTRPTRTISPNKTEKPQARSIPDWWVSLPPIVPDNRPIELQEHQQYLKELESKRVAGKHDSQLFLHSDKV